MSFQLLKFNMLKRSPIELKVGVLNSIKLSQGCFNYQACHAKILLIGGIKKVVIIFMITFFKTVYPSQVL